jgi:hypothetical protein
VEKDPVGAQFFIDQFEGVLQLSLRQAVQGSLFKNTVNSKIWPLLEHVDSLPEDPSLQVPFLTFPLIN